MKKNGKFIAMLMAGMLFVGTVFAGGSIPARADEDPEGEEAVFDEAAAEEEISDDAEVESAEEEVSAEDAAEAAEEDEALLDTLANPPSMEYAYINGITNRRYTGSAIKLNTIVVQSPDYISDSKPYWREGVDYKVTYSNNTKAGTATVKLTGMNGVTDSVTKTFKIVTAPSWERLAGASGTGALGTQEKITKKFTSSYYAVVVTNQDFLDAMNGAALAGVLKAPLLTTSPKSLSTLTKNELYRLGVRKVIIVGDYQNVNGVSEDVKDEIEYMGIETERVYSEVGWYPNTAAKTLDHSINPSDTLIVANHLSFKDALSISPYSYATGSPIIYHWWGELDDYSDLNTFLDDYPNLKKVIIVGGPKAVPEEAEKYFKRSGFKVTRLGGAGCYNTSRIIAEWEMGKLANGTNSKTGSLYKYTNVTFQPAVKLGINNMGVSRGDGWKDALAGSALCGMYKSILLLADGSNQANTALVKKYKKNIAKAYVFGGTQAVPKKVYDAFVKASK